MGDHLIWSYKGCHFSVVLPPVPRIENAFKNKSRLRSFEIPQEMGGYNEDMRDRMLQQITLVLLMRVN
jgi:hypothetical protein